MWAASFCRCHCYDSISQPLVTSVSAALRCPNPIKPKPYGETNWKTGEVSCSTLPPLRMCQVMGFRVLGLLVNHAFSAEATLVAVVVAPEKAVF